MTALVNEKLGDDLAMSPSKAEVYTESQIDYSPEEEKVVLRKIQRTVLTLMCLIQHFQYKI
ncbi:putative Major facilitator superfamily (MFS) profile domain-containing protein [Seiridium unicorne]|uniref:Major facilitator superfamily (MFS) profile domain-containing protein n=1 Tax=Seiridium unicorne TaxID=138068 RepID=A0ABR2UGL9_9PEZI